MILEDLNSKDCAQSYSQATGWAVVSHDCEYEAWTTENRFRRVYHLSPCEEIVVCLTLKEASQLANRHNGRAVTVGEYKKTTGGRRVMKMINEIYADIAELKKLFGTDKTSPNRLKGIMEQLGDNSLLAIGTVVPPIRQDEEAVNKEKKESVL